MNNMSVMERIAYNNTPIPSLDNIMQLAQSEIYTSMIKFKMTERSIVTPNYWLFVPHKLVHQYTGKEYEEFNNRVDDWSRKEDINGLEFWYSNRGITTKMIIIPEVTHTLLKEIEETKIFRNYFENKVSIHLSNALGKSFIIPHIEAKFRRNKIKYKFQAENHIYVEISKIIPSQTYSQLKIEM
jgi:hypothetical protein